MTFSRNDAAENPFASRLITWSAISSAVDTYSLGIFMLTAQIKAKSLRKGRCRYRLEGFHWRRVPNGLQRSNCIFWTGLKKMSFRSVVLCISFRKRRFWYELHFVLFYLMVKKKLLLSLFYGVILTLLVFEIEMCRSVSFENTMTGKFFKQVYGLQIDKIFINNF